MKITILNFAVAEVDTLELPAELEGTQIESLEGVKNIDEILSFDQIDGVMIGPYDISGSLGVPGELNHPKVVEASKKVIKACEKFVALRYFNVYGPGEEHKGKMASVAYQAYKAGNFKLFPGDIKRDFVYVTDIVRANLHAMTLERGVFDVGTGEAETFEELVRGMRINYDFHSKDIIPNWYQYFTQANKDKFMPGWFPIYRVVDGTKEYRQYLNK